MTSHNVFITVSRILAYVPRLWTQTIDAHRREVHEAILETTAALVAQHGLAAVTMSQIAQNTGIGRATLYKYFPDVEAILMEWHQRHVHSHLERLVQVRDQADEAAKRLGAVLEAYASLRYERTHGTELAALVHRGEHISQAEQRVSELMRDVLSEAVATGDVRHDVPPDELANYCINALAAARSLTSKAAVRRLVLVTLAGLRPAR